MVHQVENPFPVNTKAGIVVDERCTCGHLRSEHHDTIAYGHADCQKLTCNCLKFTWLEFIFKTM